MISFPGGKTYRWSGWITTEAMPVSRRSCRLPRAAEAVSGITYFRI